jgi:hypothetical protein
MSIWDSVGTTYVEAATTALPLHRAIVFAIGFIGSLAIKNQTHLSILETVASFPLNDLTSFSTGPLREAIFADVLAGVFLTISGWLVSRVLLRAIFSLAARSTDLWKRVTESESAIGPSNSLAERLQLVELIDSSLVETRAHLRSLSGGSELLCALVVGCLLASHWGNVLDIFGGVLSLATAIIVNAASVRIFLADYFGPALLKAQLQGKKASSLNAHV